MSLRKGWEQRRPRQTSRPRGTKARASSLLHWAHIAPIPAIVLGASAAIAHGVALRAFASNAAAVVVGIGSVLLLERASRECREALANVVPWLVVAAGAAALAGPGLAGVHRWVWVGPILLNVSEALTPWILLAFASSKSSTRERGALALVAMQAVHLAQPDAAQATAVAAAAVPLVVGTSGVRAWVAGATVVALAGMAALAWTRLDPLWAVPHVEGMFRLIAARGFAWVVAAVLAAALAVVPLVAVPWGPNGAGRGRAMALGLLAVVPAVCTRAGNYPVPLFGAGAGTVLGWYALRAVGVLLREGAEGPHGRPG